MAFDRHNNLYLTDYARLRRVAAGSNLITTVAGTSVYKYGGDGGPAIEVPLSSPIDVAVDNVGNVYLLDSDRVRKLTPFSSGSAVVTGVRGLTRDR